MVCARRPILAALAGLAALSTLAACSGKPRAVRAGGDAASADEASEVAPPQVDAVRAGPGGVTVSGTAPADAQVRLASPTGQALFAPSGPQGRWTIVLPPAAEPRIYGLSATAQGRQTQAEGYVLVTPEGHAALLRAGAGAQRIDPAPRPSLRAIDFDRGGGLDVTAGVAPGATVIVELDGHQAAEGRADARGRYEVSLGSPNPIRLGAHTVKIYGDGFTDQAVISLTPAAPLAQGPLHSQLTPAGLRVDWMTPGGGVQSTLLPH